MVHVSSKEQVYEYLEKQTKKFDMKYVSKILENWHEKGYKTPDDIEEKKKNDNTESESFATYDLDLFEKMINSNLR